MLFIADRSAVQANSVWKIINPEITKENLTYFSPGGYSFEDKQKRVICFDWCDSCSDFDEEDNRLLDVTQYSLDYDHINSCLESDGYDELIKKEHRLELFKDFEKMIETYCTIDIDGEEVPYENNIECIYFEVYDPILEKKIVLIGDDNNADQQ